MVLGVVFASSRKLLRVVLYANFYLSYFDPLLDPLFLSAYFRFHLPGAVRIGFVDHHAVRYARRGYFSMLVLMERAAREAPRLR